MSTTPSKPSTVSGAYIVGTIGIVGGTDDFVIKADEWAFGGRLGQILDATGDGDAEPCLVSNGLLYTEIRISGWVLNGTPAADWFVGLASMVDDTKNPVANLEITLDNNKKLAFAKGLISNVQIRGGRRAPATAVAFTLQGTETPASGLEAAV